MSLRRFPNPPTSYDVKSRTLFPATAPSWNRSSRYVAISLGWTSAGIMRSSARIRFPGASRYATHMLPSRATSSWKRPYTSKFTSLPPNSQGRDRPPFAVRAVRRELVLVLMQRAEGVEADHPASLPVDKPYIFRELR
jgi:hypothetical protein